MNVEELIDQINDLIASGQIDYVDQVVLTTLEGEYQVHSIEAQDVARIDTVLSIQSDEGV
jgi:hypothetical protein